MASSGLSLDRDLLPRLTRALTTSLGLSDVLAATSRAAGDLVPDAFVLLWLQSGDRLRLRAAAGILEATHSGLPIDVAVGEGLAGHVARVRQAVVIGDAAHDPRASHPQFLRAERVRWFVGVPLAGRYALQGVLGVFIRGGEPPRATLEALGALAAQAALVVEGVRLEAERERRRRVAEALEAVSQALARSLDPSEVSQLVADNVLALLGARSAAVYRLELESGILTSVAFAGADAEGGEPLVLPHGVGLAGRAVLERRLLVTPDVVRDPRLVLPAALRARLQALGLRAVIAAPLLVGEEVIGALGVGAGPGRSFDDQDHRLLEAFADQAAIVLRTSRLFAGERRARADAEAAGRRFRDLVESLDAVVVEIDVSTRRVLFVSRRAETLLGYPLAQWTDDPHFLITHLHPQDRSRVTAVTQAETAAGQDHVQEYRMLTADGRTVWVRESASLVHEPGLPPRLRCLYVDITERKRTEALLAGEKLLLEMIAAGESLPGVLDALCRTVEEQGDDGMLCSILLLEGERLRHGAAPGLPREYVEAIDGLAIGPDAGSCGTAAHRRQPVIVEDVAADPLWARYRDLALRHGLRACWSMPVLDVAGLPVATFAVYYRTPRRPSEMDRRLIERAARLANIAIERMRAAEALRASEQRYRTLLTSIPDVAWLVDRNGHTLFISPNTERVSGYTVEEICRGGAEGWFGRIHPDDRPLVRRQFEALFENGGTFDLEYRMRRKSGGWFWVHDRAVATYEGQGTTYVYGLYSDITDRKQAEEIRALLLNQVITVQEEERRRIARELHDETAQSLASLLLGLSALQEARTVKGVRAQARELHQVATRALGEVRRLAWGLRPSVLDDLGLTAALERYAANFGRTRGIAVELATGGLGAERLAAPVEIALYRIMQEALSNVARHAGARHVRLTLARDPALVSMVIEDDGRGFDPARPPERPTIARGLGIHTMRERAAVLRGTLVIDAAPGRGTRVTVEIPV